MNVSDKTFEPSLTALTVVVLLWIVVGIVLRVLTAFPIPIGWVVILGILVEAGVGGYLLHLWGKEYMAKG